MAFVEKVDGKLEESNCRACLHGDCRRCAVSCGWQISAESARDPFDNDEVSARDAVMILMGQKDKTMLTTKKNKKRRLKATQICYRRGGDELRL